MPDIFITMIKQNWNISTDEAKRILMMHESATKNQYLVNEQRKIVTKTLEPKQFKLPNNTFQSGKYLEFDKIGVDNVIQQMNDYLKNYPLNQKINVEIESSESNVPNKSLKNEDGKPMAAGDLSRLRGKTMENYLRGKLPKNVNLVIKDLGAQGPSWSPSKTATAEQIRQLANDPSYTQWQYVTFNIVGGGEKKEEYCDLGFSIIIDYREEWCKPNKDESLCHKCNNAVFRMFANDIPLQTSDGSYNISLNNMLSGYGKSGPSVVRELIVTAEQKKQILEKNPEEIVITYGCALPDCHSDPAHITIINSAGQVLIPGIFLTAGGDRMSSKNPPVPILKLNKCGEKLWAATLDTIPKKVSKPKVVPFFTDAMNDDGLMKLYKLIGADGTFKIPEDQKEYFSKYKDLEGKTWEQVMDALNMPGYRKREFRTKIQNN
jgi:hypothetical protein